MADIADERLRELCARANAGSFIPPPELRGNTVMAREFKLPKNAKLTKQSFGGGEAKYPWDEWFAGKLLLLERSSGPENSKGTIEDGTETEKRDYGVPKNAMPPKIKTAARRRYKMCDIYTRDHNGDKLPNDGLLIQARDMTAEERAEEDLLRAEEKAARKADAEANGAPAAAAPRPAAAASLA